MSLEPVLARAAGRFAVLDRVDAGFAKRRFGLTVLTRVCIGATVAIERIQRNRENARLARVCGVFGGP